MYGVFSVILILAVLTQYRRVTDGHAHRLRPTVDTSVTIASCG